MVNLSLLKLCKPLSSNVISDRPLSHCIAIKNFLVGQVLEKFSTSSALDYKTSEQSATKANFINFTNRSTLKNVESLWKLHFPNLKSISSLGKIT